MADFNLSAKLQITQIETGNQLRRLESQLNSINKRVAGAGGNLQSSFGGVGLVAADVNKLSKEVSGLSSKIQGQSDATKKARESQASLNKTTKQGVSNVQDFADKAGLALRRFTAFSIAAGGVFGSLRAISSATKDAIDFERQLLKVTQVSTRLGDSLQGITGIRNTIGDLSTEYGAAAGELVSAAKTFSQAGLNLKEVQSALVAVARSDLLPTFNSIGDTAEGLISIYRQFGIEAEDFSGALSQINAVSGRFAIESGDFVKAIQRAGGVFNTASEGVGTASSRLSEFLALVTSVRATTRESAETIGTGLRTIIGRLQRPDNIKFFENLGVQLKNADGQFIGSFNAITKLGNAITSLPDRSIALSEIVERFGGLRQLSRAIPLLTETETRTKALREAQQSLGSSQDDVNQAFDNLGVQLSQINEQFKTFIRDVVNSNSFQTISKSVLSLSSNLLGLASALSEIIPLLGLVSGARLAGSFLRQGGPRQFSRRFRNNSPPERLATGGTVPGSGSGDIVPAMLEPGEFVINKKAATKLGPAALRALNSGNKLPGFKDGGDPTGFFKFFRDDGFRKTIDKLSSSLLKLGFSAKQTDEIVRNSIVGARGPGEAEKFANQNVGKIIEKTQSKAAKDIVEGIKASNKSRNVERTLNERSPVASLVKKFFGGKVENVGAGGFTSVLPSGQKLNIKIDPKDLEGTKTRGRAVFGGAQGQSSVELKTAERSLVASMGTLRHEALHIARNFGYINEVEFRRLASAFGAGGLKGTAQEEAVARALQNQQALLPSGDRNTDKKNSKLAGKIRSGKIFNDRTPTRSEAEARAFVLQNQRDSLSLSPQQAEELERSRAAKRSGGVVASLGGSASQNVDRSQLSPIEAADRARKSATIGPRNTFRRNVKAAFLRSTRTFGSSDIAQRGKFAAAGLATAPAKLRGAAGGAALIGAAAAGQSDNPFVSNVATSSLAGGFLARSAGGGPGAVVAGAAIGAVQGFNAALVEAEKNLKKLEFESFARVSEEFSKKLQDNSTSSEEAASEAINFAASLKSLQRVQERNSGNLASLATRSEDARGGRGVTDEGIAGARREENLINANATTAEKTSLLFGESDIVKIIARLNPLQDSKQLAADTTGLRTSIVSRIETQQARERANLARPGASSAEQRIRRLVRSGKSGDITDELRIAAGQSDFGVQRGGSNILAKDIGSRFEEEEKESVVTFNKLRRATLAYRDTLDALNKTSEKTEDIFGIFQQEVAAASAASAGITARGLGNFSETTGTAINPFENIRALSGQEISTELGLLRDSGVGVGGRAEKLIQARGVPEALSRIVDEAGTAGIDGGAFLTEGVQSAFSPTGELFGKLPKDIEESFIRSLQKFENSEGVLSENISGENLTEGISAAIETATQQAANIRSGLNARNDFARNAANQRQQLLARDQSLANRTINSRAGDVRQDAAITGRSIGLDESLRLNTGEIRAKTGGTLDPLQISKNISAIEKRRKEINSDGIVTDQERTELSELNQAQTNNTSALEALSAGVVNLADVQSKLARIEERRQQAQDATLGASFGGPEQNLENLRGVLANRIFQESGGDFRAVAAAGFTRQDVGTGSNQQIAATAEEDRDALKTRQARLASRGFSAEGRAAIAARGGFGLQGSGREATEIREKLGGERTRRDEATDVLRKITQSSIEVADAFNSDNFDSMTKRLQDIGQTFQNLKIEGNITGNVDVNINGLEVLSELDPILDSKITELINARIAAQQEGNGSPNEGAF